MKRQFKKNIFLFVLLISLISGGCRKTDKPAAQPPDPNQPLRNSKAEVLTPAADGTVIYENENLLLDASHISEGYLMIKYTGTADKVKLQLTSPDQIVYTYLVPTNGDFQVYPFSGGDGPYRTDLYECIDPADDMYALAFTQDLAVSLSDPFKPFLYPNAYVNFTTGSEAVSLGESLAEDCYSDFDVISNVYHYITETITYDKDKAKSVTYGYLPDNDETLKSKSGICFDYASLMAAMLRSQKIPTKLEVGYAGEVLHAWISTYITDVGWIDNIIEFDGSDWTLVDPTFGASADTDTLKEYIGDGSIYQLKYSY